jgi:hypothetical protein
MNIQRADGKRSVEGFGGLGGRRGGRAGGRAGAYRGKRGAYRRVGSFPDHFAESFPEQQSGAPAGQKYVSYDTRVAELPFRLS